MSKEELKIEIFKSLLPLTFHFLAVSPFILSLVFFYDLENRWAYFLIITLAVLSTPIVFVISIAFAGYIIPQVSEGKYTLGSKEYFFWLLKTLVFELITNSAYINNMVNRDWIIHFIVYKLMRMRTLSGYIITPNVKLSDPDKIFIGKGTFIGTGTTISPHVVRKYKNTLKVVLKNVILGEDCIVGAQCSIGPGVTISHRSKIDFYVAIESNVKIGENTIVLAGTKIYSNVTIGQNVRIGKACVIGSRVTIEDGVNIGDFTYIGSRVRIYSGEKVEELGRVSVQNRSSVVSQKSEKIG